MTDLQKEALLRDYHNEEEEWSVREDLVLRKQSINQIISDAVSNSVQYSDSVELFDIESCFLDDYDIRFFPRKVLYPPVNRLVV